MRRSWQGAKTGKDAPNGGGRERHKADVEFLRHDEVDNVLLGDVCCASGVGG